MSSPGVLSCDAGQAYEALQPAIIEETQRTLFEAASREQQCASIQVLHGKRFCVSFDRSFDEVINNCSIRNDDSEDTLITERMKKAYKELHAAGFAHSIEVRLDNVLVGGLYGVSLGTMFFGESMFSRVSNASKIALYHLEKKLLEWQFSLIDCQIMNPHLDSLGAINIPRRQFIDMVSNNPITKTKQGNWSSQI